MRSETHEELPEYAADERAQNARIALRVVSSEVNLILTAGFAMIALLSVLLAPPLVTLMSCATGMRSTAVWMMMSFGTAMLWAYFHSGQSCPRIAHSKDLHAAFLHQYQQKRAEEHHAKMTAMQDARR